MQQFTPYFPGYDANQQQQQQGQQGQQAQQPEQAQPGQQTLQAQNAQNAQNQPQDQQQQQQQQHQQQQPPLGLNGANLAIYNPAAMQSLTVMAPNQIKPDAQQGTGEAMDMGAHGKPKRKQVKNACVNCQKACKKCDVGRPCQRCIKYGLTETCVNSVRKERKKGVKRGPYKKRNKTGESVASSGTATPNMASPMTNTMLNAQNSNVRPPMPYHYQPFPGGHYDPYGYAAAAAAAASNGQMMPQAYMVPAAIQQMYPTNPPVLSYQAAMSMISPQHQQAPVSHGGYRPVPIQPQPSADANVNSTGNSANAAGTPTESAPAQAPAIPAQAPAIPVTAQAPAQPTVQATETGTTSTNTTSTATTAAEADEEGSKLTMLSKLCSDELDRNGQPKQDVSIKAEEITAADNDQTASPNTHNTSQDNNSNAVAEPAANSSPAVDATTDVTTDNATSATTPIESPAVTAGETAKAEVPTSEQTQEQQE